MLSPRYTSEQMLWYRQPEVWSPRAEKDNWRLSKAAASGQPVCNALPNYVQQKTLFSSMGYTREPFAPRARRPATTEAGPSHAAPPATPARHASERYPHTPELTAAGRRRACVSASLSC